MRRLVFGLGLEPGRADDARGGGRQRRCSAWALALLGRAWGLGWQSAVALGGALAMSSHRDRRQADGRPPRARERARPPRHGRAAVPGPRRRAAAGADPGARLVARGAAAASSRSPALKAAVLLTVLLVGGQRVMRWWLTLVVRRKSEELFVLNLLLVTLGLAWLTEHAGLSLALGAFVAGMLIAETEYKHQVETDIRPFHDVLLGLFFITVGMKLDVAGGRWRSGRWCWRLTVAPVLLQVRARHRARARLRRRARAWRCAPASTWPRPANSASCCWPWPPSGGLLPESLQSAGAGQHGAVDAGDAVHLHVQQPDRDAPVGERLAAAVGRDDDHRQARDQRRGPRHHLRLRPQRPEPGAPARGREDRLHRARPRPRPRPPGRRRRAERGLRRRGAAAEPDGGRPGAGQRGRRQLPRHALGAEDPAPRAGTRADRCR